MAALMANASSSSTCRTRPHAGVDLGQAHGQLRQVHRARRGVDHRDRDEEQHRRQQRDDDVDGPRADALAGAAERDEHVAGGQQDLEADVEVEQVARQERVGDARRQHQVRRVVDRDRGGLLVVLAALREGVQQDAEGDRAGDREHERREPVRHQVDADGRRPAADVHDERAVVGEHEQGHAGDEHEREGHHRDEPLHVRPAVEREREAGGGQRDDDGERDEPGVVGHGCTSRVARRTLDRSRRAPRPLPRPASRRRPPCPGRRRRARRPPRGARCGGPRRRPAPRRAGAAATSGRPWPAGTRSCRA